MNQDTRDKHGARQASYLIGLCLLEQGDLPAALSQMQRTSEFFRETPEDLAALYQQGDIARRMGRHPEAVTAYRRLVTAAARQEEFHNPWISLTQLKATLLDVCQEYLKAEKYETAVLFSKSLAHLVPKLEALQLTARIYRTWGENVMEVAEHLPPEQAEGLRKEARRQFRRAGDTLTEIAREQYTTRQYPDLLWDLPAPTLPATTSAMRQPCCGCTCTTSPAHGTPRPSAIWARPNSRWARHSAPCSRCRSASSSTPATWPSIGPNCWPAGPR